MDHPDFIVSSFMECSICLKRVEVVFSVSDCTKTKQQSKDTKCNSE